MSETRQSLRCTVLAPAKVNRLLAVGARRADGFHEVASIMQTLDLADRIDIDLERWDQPRSDVLVEAPGVPGGDTLVTRAVHLLLERAGCSARIWITIEKEIPIGAGLGGGSSDAAAALLAVNELLGSPLDHASLSAIAAQIGSDVAFFLGGTCACAWVTGRGERVEPITPLPPQSWLLAWPRAHQSTADVYGALDAARSVELPASAGVAVQLVTSGVQRNDLAPAARSCCPALDRLARAIEDAGGDVLVCGSGSCIAVPVRSTEALDAFAAVARNAVSDCWIRPASSGVH